MKILKNSSDAYIILISLLGEEYFFNDGTEERVYLRAGQLVTVNGDETTVDSKRLWQKLPWELYDCQEITMTLRKGEPVKFKYIGYILS